MTDDNLIGNNNDFITDDVPQPKPYAAYRQTEEMIKNQQRKMDPEEAQREQEEQDEADKRLLRPEEFQPTNSIDMAHLLLSPSQLTSFTPELDKEMAISNLKPQDKAAIWEHQKVWDDLQFMKDQKVRRKREFEIRYGTYDKFNKEDSIMEQVENDSETRDLPQIMDQLSALRRSLRIAKISRGTDGFEREMQVKTIKESKEESVDKTERKPGFAERMMGGMKK